MPNIPRLKHLITVLQAVPPEQFDMSDWYWGTSACTFGWASLDPEFQRQGLVPSPRLNNAPTFGTKFGFAAAEEFFDVYGEQSTLLFSTMGNRKTTPQDIIARIESIIA